MCEDLPSIDFAPTHKIVPKQENSSQPGWHVRIRALHNSQAIISSIYHTRLSNLPQSPYSCIIFWPAAAIDREDRLRMIKDRQNEERQRKLEELKQQAAAAQKYREQKEEERRRRIEDLRVRELDRKQQVEERKRAIQDAEKDRRDYILRKNQVSRKRILYYFINIVLIQSQFTQERDSRIETKRRSERSQIAFAFGSSTPRLLDPVDVGTMSNSSLWAHRRYSSTASSAAQSCESSPNDSDSFRSTSISNVAYTSGGTPLSRRSSERELSDSAAKKRATSAGGLDRNDGMFCFVFPVLFG